MSEPSSYMVQVSAPGSANQYDQYWPVNSVGHGSGRPSTAQMKPLGSLPSVKPAASSASVPVTPASGAHPAVMAPPRAVASTTTVTPWSSAQAPARPGSVVAAAGAASRAPAGAARATAAA
ncbi:MAG: hypothetical protein H5T83_00500, partial [Actinotalea sp.]|nr:hypothetical protein [Actinotalea sp.]